MEPALKEKIIIVTCGAQGLGAAQARAICREGGKVVVGDVLGKEGSALASALNREYGDGTALFLHLDVRSAAQWSEAVEVSHGTFGKITGLVNNTGIAPGAAIADTTDEEWERTIDTDLKGVWLGMKAVIPALRAAGGGSIVNASSHGGLIASGRAVSYHTARGAVAMLTKAAAAEYARQNIRVNCVHPGLTDEGADAAIPADRRKSLLQRIPMGRAAKPSEIASAIVFLLSEYSAYMTGASVVIDGGLTAA